MSSAGSSPRAAAAAPYARRKTRRALSRTGLAESRRRRRDPLWQEDAYQNLSDHETELRSHSSGSMTYWQESEAEAERSDPVMELMDDICSALDRLGRKGKERRSGNDNAISVRQLRFVWSTAPMSGSTSSRDRPLEVSIDALQPMTAWWTCMLTTTSDMTTDPQSLHTPGRVLPYSTSTSIIARAVWTSTSVV